MGEGGDAFFFHHLFIPPAPGKIGLGYNRFFCSGEKWRGQNLLFGPRASFSVGKSSKNLTHEKSLSCAGGLIWNLRIGAEIGIYSKKKAVGVGPGTVVLPDTF